MKDFGRKIGLIQGFETTITLEESVFLKRFQDQFQEKERNAFMRFLDWIQSKSKQMHGNISGNTIHLVQSNMWMSSQMGKTVASGEYIVDGDKIKIQGEISSFNRQIVLMFLLLTCVYATFFIAMVAAMFGKTNPDFPILFVAPFILFHGLFMYGMLYRFSIGSVKSMKNTIVKELYYLTKSD